MKTSGQLEECYCGWVEPSQVPSTFLCSGCKKHFHPGECHHPTKQSKLARYSQSNEFITPLEHIGLHVIVNQMSL